MKPKSILAGSALLLAATTAVLVGHDALTRQLYTSFADMQMAAASRIASPTAALLVHLPDPYVKPVGSLELVIRELRIDQGKPVSFEGRVIWRNLGLDDSGIKIDLGDYQLEVSGETPKYDLKLSDLDASLDVKGDGELSADGVYQVDVVISSDLGIDPQIKTVLELVAKTMGHDKYRIQQSGRLPPAIASQLF